MDSFDVAMATLRGKIRKVVEQLDSDAHGSAHELATALIMSEVEPGYRAMWEECEQLRQAADNGIRLLEQSERQKADLEIHLAATNQALEEVAGLEGRHPQWRNFVKSERGMLPEGTDFLSLAKNTLLDEVNAYVSEVELGAVKCRCEWLIHPEDVHLSPDQQRKRRGMESEFCATHSKRGLVLGLFEYLFGTEETVIPAEQTEARSRLYTEYQNRLRRRMVDHLKRKGYPDNQAQSIVHDFLPMIAGDFRGAWELVDYLKIQLIMQYTSPVTDIIGNNTGAPLGFLSTFDEVPPTRGLEMSDGSRHCFDQAPHAEHVWSGSESGAEFTATCPGTTEA